MTFQNPQYLVETGWLARHLDNPAIGLTDPSTHAYLDAATLRARFADAGALNWDRVITHCGGGIAASSDTFVLMLLGVGNVALYNGSMKEWAADPDLPLQVAD